MALTDFPMPPEAALDAPPLTDDELAVYFDVMDRGPNAELRNGVDNIDPAEEEAIEVGASVAAWRVEDDAGAEWALRKLAVAQEDTRRLAEQAQEWQARIGAWFQQASRTPQRTAALMEEKLADYALRLREAGGPATLTLPSGVVKTTERKPAIEVEDDSEVGTRVHAALDVEFGLPEDADAPWRAAWKASGIESMEALVAWKPKVYVGPLRKMLHIEERPTGKTRITLTLACDHEVSEVVAELPDPEAPAALLGSSTACDLCPVDSLDGEAMQTVVAVQVEALTELVAVGPDGEPVPGASVRPGEVVPKVEAR